MSFFVSKEIEDKIDESQFYDDNIVFVCHGEEKILSGIIIEINYDKIKIKTN